MSPNFASRLQKHTRSQLCTADTIQINLNTSTSNGGHERENVDTKLKFMFELAE